MPRKDNVFYTVFYRIFPDGEELFLDLDVKLTKYAPTGWKEGNNKKKKFEYVLYFRVKFFLQDPRMLK